MPGPMRGTEELKINETNPPGAPVSEGDIQIKRETIT